MPAVATAYSSIGGGRARGEGNAEIKTAKEPPIINHAKSDQHQPRITSSPPMGEPASSTSSLARRVAARRRIGGEVRHHASFLTADFRSDDGFEIDVVRARSE